MSDYAPLDRKTQRLFVDVPEVIADNLAAMARKIGVSRNVYVKQLFEAAYSARCAPTDDRELDAAMRSPAIGSGAPANPPYQGSGGRRDSDAIANLERKLAAERRRAEKLAADLRAAEDDRRDLSHRLSMALTAQKLRACIETLPESDPRPQITVSRPVNPSLTRGEIKIVRGLASVGKSAAKIAKEMGFPAAAVTSALTGAGGK
jgi:hypothetical protein